MPAPKSKPAPEVTGSNLRALLDKAEAGYPESWVPENKGDQIAGKFLRVERGMTGFGPAPIVVLEMEDGTERSVWLLSETLRSGFGRIRPASGDNIAVLYLGKQKVKNQAPGRASEYHNFRVVSDKTTTESSWDSILGPAETYSAPESVTPDDEDIPL